VPQPVKPLDTIEAHVNALYQRVVRLERRPIGGSSELPLSQQSSSYTLVLADAETCVEFTGSSAENCTIPPNSSVAFPEGAWVQVRQYGAGQVTFVAGSGVTLRSPAGAVKTCQQYTTVVAHQRATDEWVLVGDLV
jgi:hypothetical protein